MVEVDLKSLRGGRRRGVSTLSYAASVAGRQAGEGRESAQDWGNAGEQEGAQE